MSREGEHFQYNLLMEFSSLEMKTTVTQQDACFRNSMHQTTKISGILSLLHLGKKFSYSTESQSECRKHLFLADYKRNATLYVSKGRGKKDI
jgi:hypothetical protein